MTTLDELDNRCIAVPYDPEQVVGEFGWLWMGKAMIDDWVLVRTIEDDSDGLLLEAWEPEDTHDCHSVRDPEDWRGHPYIPVHQPKCGPMAGAMVCVWLPGGGTITVTHEDRDDAARRMMDNVLSLLREGRSDA